MVCEGWEPLHYLEESGLGCLDIQLKMTLASTIPKKQSRITCVCPSITNISSAKCSRWLPSIPCVWRHSRHSELMILKCATLCNSKWTNTKVNSLIRNSSKPAINGRGETHSRDLKRMIMLRLSDPENGSCLMLMLTSITWLYWTCKEDLSHTIRKHIVLFWF